MFETWLLVDMSPTVIKGPKSRLPRPRFFEYSQNNSGGHFIIDEGRGIGHQVIVEATSAMCANDIAKQIGVYFHTYTDCECCGPRWSWQYSDKESYDFKDLGVTRFSNDDEKRIVFVHYLDGTITRYEV